MVKRMRRRYLILPSFQFKLIRYALTIFIFSALISFGALMFIFEALMIAANKYQARPELIAEIKNIESFTSIYYMLIVILGIAAILFFGVRATNLIAGPFYRLTNHLKKMNSGETVAEIKFRDQDLVGELEQVFNKHLEIFRAALKQNPPTQG